MSVHLVCMLPHPHYMSKFSIPKFPLHLHLHIFHNIIRTYMVLQLHIMYYTFTQSVSPKPCTCTTLVITSVFDNLSSRLLICIFVIGNCFCFHIIWVTRTFTISQCEKLRCLILNKMCIVTYEESFENCFHHFVFKWLIPLIFMSIIDFGSFFLVGCMLKYGMLKYQG